MDGAYAIHNVRLLEDGEAIRDGLLIVEDGRIAYAGPAEGRELPRNLKVINGGGGYLTPGLIDIQINGAYGHDFSEDPAALRAVARRLPESGVTAFLPTFITSPLEAYPAMLAQVQAAQAQQAAGEARILGAHIEGPFLSPGRKGAHRGEVLCDPSPEALAHIHPLEAVRLLTLAPERPGALGAIRSLAAQGVTVAIGHSDAEPEAVLAALEAGARLGTHLFNAMRPMQARDPGVAGALLADGRAVCGLIADGVHVHPAMLRLAVRCLGAERIALVTDAMAAMGMPPGEYSLAGEPVTVDAASARLRDGVLAGSILRMDAAIRNMISLAGCTPAQAVHMATATPAAALGLADEYGHLRPGRRADFVWFDSQFNIQACVISGQWVY